MPTLPTTGEWDFPNAATPLGSPAYYAIRFSAPEARQRFALLFAWRQQIVDISAQAHDPGVARLKLDWWREEIATIVEGRPRHPLAEALSKTRLAPTILEPMRGMIDAAETELMSDGVADDQAFTQACRDEGGNLFRLLNAAATDCSDDEVPCSDLGGYCSAVERVRLGARQPRRIPRDLARMIGDNPADASLRERCAALLPEPVAPSTAGQEPIPGVCRRLLALGRAMHVKLARKGYPVAEMLVERPPIAHLWTAWRCR